MPEGPEVAVVVGAYQREQFLLSALDSALAQTLPRDRYEVIVTKNFANPDIDWFLEEQRIPSITDNDPRIGRWLLKAVAATRAPYVAFLDDDDEFEPDRLAHALDVLHADPGLGFYRNRVRVINEQGEPVPTKAWRFYALDSYFDGRGPVAVPAQGRDGLAELGLERTRVSFNSSTMIVRRELLEGEFGAAFARTQLPDVTLFVLAAMSPFGLYLDDRRLTRYRDYVGKGTHRVPWLRHACEAYRDLASLTRAHESIEFADRLARVSDHYDRQYRAGTIVDRIAAGADRREVARRAGEYLRFLGQHPAERSLTLDVWAAEVYAAADLLLPGVARRVSARQMARRRS